MKRIAVTAIAVMMSLLTVLPTSVAYAEESITPCAISTEPGIEPQREQVKWYYRTNENGVEEMRLWSLTYGRWMTGWIPVYP